MKTASSSAMQYSEQMAAWSQPLDGSQTGYRVGPSPFASARAARSKADTQKMMRAFFGTLPSPASSPPLNPRVLRRPLAIPQSTSGSSNAPFVRAVPGDHDAAYALGGSEQFLRFLEIVNALLATESSDTARRLRTTRSIGSLSNHSHFPPPHYSSPTNALDDFIARANRAFFQPRGLTCHILSQHALDRRLASSSLFSPSTPKHRSSDSLSSLSIEGLFDLVAADPSERRLWSTRHATLPLRAPSNAAGGGADGSERLRWRRWWEEQGGRVAMEHLLRLGRKEQLLVEARNAVEAARPELWLVVDNL